MCIASANNEGTLTRDGITGIFHTSLKVHVWHNVILPSATTSPGEMSLSGNMIMDGNHTASSHSGTRKETATGNANSVQDWCACDH